MVLCHDVRPLSQSAKSKIHAGDCDVILTILSAVFQVLPQAVLSAACFNGLSIL